MAEYGIWQGAERASGNVLATGMRLMEFNANRQDAGARRLLEQDRIGLLKEAAGRERQAFEHAEKKRVEQEAIDNAFVPASMVAPKIHSLPKFKQMAVDAAKKAGFKVEESPDGELYAPNKAFAYINNLMKTNTDFMKASVDNTLADLTDQSVAITQQIAQLQQSGKADEKTLGPLQQQQLAVKKQIGEIISVRENVMSKILGEQAKATTIRQSVKDYVDAEGNIVPIDVNDPMQRGRITMEGLIPYEKPEAKSDRLPTEASLAEREAAGDPLAKEAGRILREGKRAGATKVNQSVSTGEGADLISKEAGKKYGSTIGDRAAKRDAGAEEGIAQNYQLDLVGSLIDQGARTGYGEETLLNLRSAAQTLGINTGNLGGEEVIRKISNEMALRLRNPDSGLGLTGNTSNKDLDFLKASVVGLNRTEQGNKAIISAMKKYNQFKIALAQEQQRLIQQNKGGIPSDLDRKLLQFANSYQFFTPAERNQIKVVSGGKSKSDVMKALKGANPGVSDSDLEAYAKKQGYIQ